MPDKSVCENEYSELLGKLKIKYAVPPLFLILFILKILKGNPMHGYQITDRLNTILGINISRQIVYFILKKMEEAGLVSSKWLFEKELKPRRMYSITDDGKIFLEKMIPYLKTLMEKIEEM